LEDRMILSSLSGWRRGGVRVRLGESVQHLQRFRTTPAYRHQPVALVHWRSGGGRRGASDRHEQNCLLARPVFTPRGLSGFAPCRRGKTRFSAHGRCLSRLSMARRREKPVAAPRCDVVPLILHPDQPLRTMPTMPLRIIPLRIVPRVASRRARRKRRAIERQRRMQDCARRGARRRARTHDAEQQQQER